MTRLQTGHQAREARKGAMAMMTAMLLVAMLGIVACALDVGWIEMTRTQLQSAADASSLAGGTELMPGLGHFKTKSPTKVADATRPVVVEYAGYNRNAERNSTYVDAMRDVKFGKTVFDSAGCNCWVKTSASDGADYYNYVEVTTLRNQASSGAGDGPLPLLFGPILGTSTKSMQATATAAVLAANGFRVVEDDDRADVMPFAFGESAWEKFLRAEAYYKATPTVFTQYPNWNTGAANRRLNQILDHNGPDPTKPLFGEGSSQHYFDQYRRTEAGVVSSGADGLLELRIYPNNTGSSGNFGTVDLGAGGNSTSELRRKIREGLNSTDLSRYENNQLTLSVDDPLNEGANPGLSNGLKSALDDVRGQCKAIALYDSLTGNGNNAVYRLVKFISVAIVYNDQAKDVRVQRCVLVDNNSVPDTKNGIDDQTTIFTPLTLIR